MYILGVSTSGKWVTLTRVLQQAEYLGSLGLNFDYDGVPSLKMGVPSFGNNKSRYTRLKGND